MNISQVLVIFLWMTCRVLNASASSRVYGETENSSEFNIDITETPAESLNKTDVYSSIDDVNTDITKTPSESSNKTDVYSSIDDVNTETEQGTTSWNNTDTDEYEKFDEDFISCQKINLDNSSYVEYPNGSVYLPSFNRIFNSRNHIKNINEITVCSSILDKNEQDTYTGEDKFSRELIIITVVGTAISAFCIVLHLIVFLAFPKMWNLPGYNLSFLCVSLLVAYTFTLVPCSSTATGSTVVGIIKSYAYLSSFFWMNVMSYDIWRSLRLATQQLRLTGNGSVKARLAKYSAYAFGVPFCLLIIGVIVNDTNADEKYKLSFHKESCWFSHKQALLVYFASPIFVMLGLNVLLFVSSFYMISRATINTAENKADLWSRFLVSLRLAVVMGLIWIFSILAGVTKAEWLDYVSSILTVLQGLFIFVSFSFTRKMRKEFQKFVHRRKASTTVTKADCSIHLTSV